ncbi:MAG TPA: hypothetical protein VFX97_13870 [Pyrinomonadaceae bacterium]|nr:hypothetical protein [Pyrinomonadaceae bacterium]
MTRTFTTTIFVLLLFAAGASAQSGRRIQAIDTLRTTIDQDIAKSEAEPEYSNIYLTELAVNKNNGSYPAVGIYRPVVKFYYTYGDREKEPYPNRLLKIVVAVARSDRQEYSEFVFNESEQMVFYLDKRDDVERRVYFAAGRPIRFEQDGRVLSLKGRSPTAIVAAILKDNVKFLSIFRRSLAF